MCPNCRQTHARRSPLAISTILKQNCDAILEGLLVCTHGQCLSEYPIIDGIPIIVADLRSYVAQNIIPIVSRGDLTATMETLLGDCCGPGSLLDASRQHLSTYAFDHYGDLDPDEKDHQHCVPGSVLDLLGKGLELLPNKIEGPVIDLGCAVGRTSFELAKTTREIVLGVDLNFCMLKMAAEILNHHRARYPKRRVGVVFDRREFSAAFLNADRVDFWACDATCLPVDNGSFALATSLNLLDCVQSPHDHLKEMGRILKAGGGALISTPYDWNANATPVESWLGGHSQRSEGKGASEPVLRQLFAGGKHPLPAADMEIVSEVDALSWNLRLHDRSVMRYQVHLMAARKKTSCIHE